MFSLDTSTSKRLVDLQNLTWVIRLGYKPHNLGGTRLSKSIVETYFFLEWKFQTSIPTKRVFADWVTEWKVEDLGCVDSRT